MPSESTNLGETPKITPEQCRMARGALNLSIPELAELVGVSRGTVERLEAGADLKASTFEKVRTALEAAGVVFIPANGEGVGVRLKKKPKRRKS